MSNERSSRKIPVTEREYLWVQDDDKGEVILHVGPTMVSPTAADRVVVDDGQGAYQEGPGRPQRMIEVGDHQYAVLYNPIEEAEPEFPNGRFRQGRNEARALRHGTRAMIPGPCSFHLRPGQKCEVRDAHQLASHQYLVVKVYGEVDEGAPYHAVTLRSAGITTFTADTLDGHGDQEPTPETQPAVLTRGQLIVIRGLDTQFYIPPSGVDIVPDLTALDVDALSLLEPPGPPREVLEEAEEEDDEGEEEKPRRRRSKRRSEPAKEAPSTPQLQRALRPAPQAHGEVTRGGKQRALRQLLTSPEVRRALERQARQDRLVREAVVLGEKEYCVVVDQDGRRNIKIGPARVFPGPYDTFQSEGSRDRVYDAFELLPHRALWLRVVRAIGREELASKLPAGFALERERYVPGDEVLLTGVAGFFFPFNEVEVLSPETGQAVVGNDHSQVFVEAIGIDQKSGIYVTDLTTGEVRLVRGKCSYLVHPGHEVHIHRTVSPTDWNHWIAFGEPHKAVERVVTTPWALSVTVPPNTAVLATKADGHRVIEGPCVELLEFEETLTYLTLSTGTPKSDADVIRTCFLRTKGNRVSDVIRIQTADFVEIDVQVSYHVTFEAEFRDEWFNHENYVQVLVEHLRSLVRSRCRQRQLADLWPELPDLLRSGILGEKVEGGERPGRLFRENGMRVTEVEVLNAEILDEEIAMLYSEVQREIVSLQIGDRRAQAQATSSRLRADLEAEKLQIEQETQSRRADFEALVRAVQHKAKLQETTDQAEARLTRTRGESQAELAQAQAEWERRRKEHELELGLLAERAEAEASARRVSDQAALESEGARSRLQQELIAARSQAAVAESEAVQSGLVEALTALGDKALLSEAAKNMNLVSLFRGKDVTSLLGEVLGGTRIAKTLQGMQDRARPDG